MLKLTAEELQNAFDAIHHHGYSALLPPPAEWSLVAESWATIREELASVDLDGYRPYRAMRIYAPKSRYNLRVVTLLHPQDRGVVLRESDQLVGQPRDGVALAPGRDLPAAAARGGARHAGRATRGNLDPDTRAETVLRSWTADKAYWPEDVVSQTFVLQRLCRHQRCEHVAHEGMLGSAGAWPF